MNYIELINNFWIRDEEWQFTPIETRLYFHLLKTANRLGWCPQWKRSDDRLTIEVGISVNAMKKARTRLVRAGLIAYVPGGKGKNNQTTYQILQPKKFFGMTETVTDNVMQSVTDTVIQTVTESVTDTVTPSPLYISTRDKHKLKLKHKQCPPTPDEVKEYFSGKLPGWEEQAELFWSHFEALGWCTSTGARIRSWEGRARYWIKEEQMKTNNNKPYGKNKSRHSTATSTATTHTTGNTGELDRLADEILGRT